MHTPGTVTAVFASSGYTVQEVVQADCQTDPDSMQYLALGLPRHYAHKHSFTILTDTQYVRLHAGLMHARGACGEVESLQDSFPGSLSPPSQLPSK